LKKIKNAIKKPLKQLTWLLVSLLLALIILGIGWMIFKASWIYYQRSDVGFLRPRQAAWAHYAFRVGFFAHISTAALALFLGFFQFFPFLRRPYLGLHRWLGWAYVGMVLGLAAPGGLIMGLYALGGWVVKLCFVFLSVFWWYYTYRMYQKAREGDYRAHGRYAWRSYALCCSAVLLRLYSFIGAYYFGLRGPEVYAVLAWLSWLPQWLWFEAYGRWLAKRV
jgi:hypothetical protein